jgi:hypothetical protein
MDVVEGGLDGMVVEYSCALVVVQYKYLHVESFL